MSSHRGAGALASVAVGADAGVMETVDVIGSAMDSVGAVNTIEVTSETNAVGPLASLFASPDPTAPSPVVSAIADLLPVPTSPASSAAPVTPPGLARSQASATLRPAPDPGLDDSAQHGSVSRSPQKKTPAARTVRVSATSRSRGSSSPPSVGKVAQTQSEPTIQEQDNSLGAENLADNTIGDSGEPPRS